MTRYVTIIIMVLWFSSGFTQSKYTVSGYIKDMENGEELIGASIYVTELKLGTSSNEYGFYSLTIPPGRHLIRYSIIGYEPFEFDIDVVGNIRQDVELKPKPIEIQSTIVTGEAIDENIALPEMSTIKINPTQIKNVPVLFGEQDLIKTIQLMPGVQAAREGNTGFYVRGGAADQNLILLDEAIVYNASHLLGFFSVFNSDAIKDAVLLKGSGPTEYGGRLSSVLDMKMKEGNSKKYAYTGGIGLIASRLTIQGPIKKDVSSFVVSGRRTYADLFLKLSSDETNRNSRLYFYDLNAKSNYRLSDNDRLFISGYFGRDVLGYKDAFNIDWGNTTATMRWNHIFNSRLFFNSSLIYSIYSYEVGITNGDDLINISSSIRNFSFKEDFQHFMDAKNTFKFGLHSTYHIFLPGKITANDQSSINEMRLKKKYSWENALYINHEFKFSPLLSFDYGLRYSAFAVLGPGDVFRFDDRGYIIDQETYGQNELIKYYGGLEPRAAVNYRLDDLSSVKLSYARNRQYLHLLSTSATTTPFDVWHPSTKIVKPGTADQLAVGYFRNFDDNNYETSIEVYYKDMRNQVDYKNGADVYFNEYVESELVFGKARSFGLELYGRKKFGRLTGWLSYTLSRTEKRFDAINDGNWFPARQDRTHDISIVSVYELSKNWTFSSTWIYNTGNAVTFPSGKYIVDRHIVNLYSERNGYRMPAYHRLDIGFTWRGVKSSWNFSLYNAYGRRNAYLIEFRESEADPMATEAVRIALFSFFPSVTYSFAF